MRLSLLFGGVFEDLIEAPTAIPLQIQSDVQKALLFASLYQRIPCLHYLWKLRWIDLNPQDGVVVSCPELSKSKLT